MTEKDNLLRVIRRDHPAWVPYGVESEVFLVSPIIERPLVTAKDDWGVSWALSESSPESGTAPVPGDYVITDISHWKEQISFPDVDHYDWSKIVQDWDRKPIDIRAINREEHLVTGALDMGIFERMSLLMGMEELMVNVVLEPELLADMADAIADYNIRVIRKFHSIYPVDMIRYGDDWGCQKQLMMSPEAWRRIWKPAVKKIYDVIHSYGMLIFQHSCGYIEPIIPDIVEMGADIWDPCQPCNNLKRIKELYGDRLTFCGGIDSQFVLEKENVTQEEVRREVRRRIDEMGAGGGYLARPSHYIPYRQYVMDAMLDEIRQYGRYQ